MSGRHVGVCCLDPCFDRLTSNIPSKDVEAVNQVFGANEVEIKWKSLEALRLLRQADQALDKIHKFLADWTEYVQIEGPPILEAVQR
jgi:hypothetical protein